MFLILSIMFCGVALGAVLRNRRWPARTAGRLILPVICLLLLCMGISVGGNREVIGNFPSLGLDALVITVGALLGSLLGAKAVYARFFKQKGTGTEAPCVIPYSPECKKTAAPGRKRRFPAAETTAAPVSAPAESRPENSSGATGTGPEKPKKSNDSLKILLSFLLGAALGIAAGQLHDAVPSESTAGQLLSFLTTAADRGSVRVLYLLMFLVGISVGSEGGILRQLRSSGLKILLVPAATILGTWAGVAPLRYPDQPEQWRGPGNHFSDRQHSAGTGRSHAGPSPGTAVRPSGPDLRGRSHHDGHDFAGDRTIFRKKFYLCCYRSRHRC